MYFFHKKTPQNGFKFKNEPLLLQSSKKWGNGASGNMGNGGCRYLGASYAL